MDARAKAEELRGLIRSVVREVLPEAIKVKGQGSSGSPVADPLGDRISAAARGRGATVRIRMANDEDLRALALTFITCRDPVAQRAVLEGKVRLELDRGAAPRAPGLGAAEVAKGVVGEAMVAEVARSHDRLVLGRAAVLTPLARDKARALGLAIVRNGR